MSMIPSRKLMMPVMGPRKCVELTTHMPASLCVRPSPAVFAGPKNPGKAHERPLTL